MASFVTPIPPPMAPTVPIPVKHPNDGPAEDEPSNKKLRNEDSLIPEEIFVARNPVSALHIHLYLYFMYL